MSAFALNVTQELYDWVTSHKGHPDPKFNPKCFYSTFLRVSDLIKHQGNVLVDAKYRAVLNRLLQEPLALDNQIPYITLDCVSGELKVNDGNHRLMAFSALGYTWFPVVVAVVSTPGADPVRHIPERYIGHNDYDNARLWRGHEKEVLRDIYTLLL
jgi:hypothetical protein